jgi:hypothetical protein
VQAFLGISTGIEIRRVESARRALKNQTKKNALRRPFKRRSRGNGQRISSDYQRVARLAKKNCVRYGENRTMSMTNETPPIINQVARESARIESAR